MRRDRPPAAGTRRAAPRSCVPAIAQLLPAMPQRPLRAAERNKTPAEAIASRALLKLRSCAGKPDPAPGSTSIPGQLMDKVILGNGRARPRDRNAPDRKKSAYVWSGPQKAEREASDAARRQDPLRRILSTMNRQSGIRPVVHPTSLKPIAGHKRLLLLRIERTTRETSRLERLSADFVPTKGLEPPHPCEYMDLNHARLPIPPLRHKRGISGAL